ncbi:hypothetical protein [Clostridium sp.]|uniref:hypothetical protein n=1 Tax=Clostridium sp. TaxID=1506 RepID=UPI0025BAB480|nr:hypothetical protein [Clostridium sp.]
MVSFLQSTEFPSQRVSDTEKEKYEWYSQCCDFIIAQGESFRNTKDIELKYNILQGKLPEEFYRKTINPYNAKNEKYTKFPATLRNYDLMKGTIRRYIGEYLSNPHDFIVSANNAEVVLSKNAKLRAELNKIVQLQIAAKIQQLYADYIKQGGNPEQFNPQEQFDVEAFIKEFNENYIDDISAQGQEILNIIKDITDDTLIYARAYFDFVSFGEFYTYSDIVGNKLIKRNVSVIDAFPIPNGNMFVEDFDMFCERRKLSYQQIIDEFDEDLSEKDREFLDTYYAKHSTSAALDYSFDVYKSYFPQCACKFTDEDKNLFQYAPNMERDVNSDLYDVWHVVWRGEAKQSIVTYINEAGFVTQRTEIGEYIIDKNKGELDVQYVWIPQVYECTRIGTRSAAIYPYKARAIVFDRDGKLPYNGLMELFPGFGKFSIIDIITPFQVFYNIVAYHREIAIAKNKLSVLLIARSLLGKVPEDTIYKMLADGVLYIDDENDQGMLRAQQVRMVNTSYGDYITQLTNLLADIKQQAELQVDMTPQRYGEIANSAGKGVTEEAITRGSMGSVLVEVLMDSVREKDYARDMDYSKLAWIDGLNTSYRDEEKNIKYFSLNVNNHIYADYVIKAKNSIKEKEKLQQLKQFAFNLGQNGDAMMAIAAITGDNIHSVKKLIGEFDKINKSHEEQLKQLDQQTEQMKQEFELQKIQIKGEEDRKLAELEGYIKKEIELIKADANMISFNAEVGDKAQQAGLQRLNEERLNLDKQKANLDTLKFRADFINKAEDRRLKEKDIDTKLQIAKENKNKYDRKK